MQIYTLNHGDLSLWSRIDTDAPMYTSTKKKIPNKNSVQDTHRQTRKGKPHRLNADTIEKKLLMNIQNYFTTPTIAFHKVLI